MVINLSDRLLDLHTKEFNERFSEGNDLLRAESKRTTLQRAHRCLQGACRDADRVVVFHAERGLSFLKSEVLKKLHDFTSTEDAHVPEILRIIHQEEASTHQKIM